MGIRIEGQRRLRKVFFGGTALLMMLILGIALYGDVAFAGFPVSNTSNARNAQGAVQAEDPSAKISSLLQAQFGAAGKGGKVQYWVVLKEQADTSNSIPNSQWADKGWYVYKTLVDKANTTQGPLLSQLKSLQVAGNVSSFTSYWIINSLVVQGDLASAQTLAANPAVQIVREPPEAMIYDAQRNTDGTPMLSTEAEKVLQQALDQTLEQANKRASSALNMLVNFKSVPLLVQHNINEVRAPQGWALGYDGTGVVVGSMDTGVRWTHEALGSHYRGNVAPPDPLNIHDYNWLDGYGLSATPIDENGHGSHTTGTILGTAPDGTFGNIGVAKGAMWMHVRICQQSSCGTQPILNGFQWTLAPYRVNGTGANPAYRPRISNNSWGGPSACDQSFRPAVQNWVNAGIFPDFATGNSGPGAGTVGYPANYPESWGTGNLNTSIPDWLIATTSSRGPSACDGSIRPHAIAPGTSICSSIQTGDSAYSCAYTGTSMATPHMAGAVAMMIEKNPNATILQMMNAITTTAFFSPTWGVRPNNDYGWGLLQVDAALNALPSGGTATPTVTGTPPTATRTATATATACVGGGVFTGSLDVADPDFTRPNTFAQGGTCTTNGVHNYDYYELQGPGGAVTASLCGGAGWDTYLIIYQAPGGVRINPFVPAGCGNAIAANDDACVLQSAVSATLVSGYYYVVVSEFSAPGGAYSLTVTAPGNCTTGTTTSTRTATAAVTGTATRIATITSTPSPTCVVNPDYIFTVSAGATIVPATTYVPGSTCNSCTVNIALPFSYSFYGTPYSQLNASNKGVLQFISNNSNGNNTCLPNAAFNDAIFAYWDDHNTNINDAMGIYTSVSGVAPNRIFNILWRSGYEANDVRSNYEVRLYEGQRKFDIIYGSTRQGFSATIGVQKGIGERSTQYSCNTSGTVPPGLMLTFVQPVCSLGPVK